MEWFSTAGTWVQTNYPVILTMGASLLAVIGTVFAIWTQIKPIIDKLNIIKDKVVDSEKEDVTNLLQITTLDTQITDLNAKIANPIISDTLKQQYISQLATLEVIKAKLDAGMAKTNEVTSKY